DDLVAQVDALVADVHAGSGDQLLDLLLALPAEGALEQVAALTHTCHSTVPFDCARWATKDSCVTPPVLALTLPCRATPAQRILLWAEACCGVSALSATPAAGRPQPHARSPPPPDGAAGSACRAGRVSPPARPCARPAPR